MLKSFRGDTIVYTLYGPLRIDNLKKDDMVLDNNGKYVKILNIDKKFIKSSIYKVKLHDSFDNSYLTKKCKVLAIQDVPYDLKNNEVKKESPLTKGRGILYLNSLDTKHGYINTSIKNRYVVMSILYKR